MADSSLQQQAVLTSLGAVGVGEHARIAEIRGDRQFARRLLSLGLRVGSEVDILHRRGGGVVVISDGNRVALGGTIADKLLVESIE